MIEEKRKHFDEPWPRARHELDERLSKNDNEMKKRLLSQSENDDELKPRKDERQPQSENDNELKPRRTDCLLYTSPSPRDS